GEMSVLGHKWTSATVYCVCRLQIIFDPVSGEIDADLAVVDMRMLCAAFFGREDLDCLVFRTDRIKELLGILGRHDSVVRAVTAITVRIDSAP
ncbi:MAG: hypothetical protein WBD96_08860, partial [Pseudolabrys sp.]